MIDPMFDVTARQGMPKLEGLIVDPARVLNPAQRREYTEQWRTWCVGKLPHEIPSFIGDLFREEQRLERQYGGQA